MTFWAVVFVFLALWGTLYALRTRRLRRRRERVRSRPFPAEWNAVLEKSVVLYRILPEDLKNILRSKILLFIDEKHFEGCGGLVVTDEMKVIIAAQACLLVLNQPDETVYSGLSSILVYPDAYIAPAYIPLDGNLYVETTGVQSGESWREGTVVLSWRDVRNESKTLRRGYNVVLHEFAHQLDEENGAADGMPILRDACSYESWQSVFRREFQKIRNDRVARRNSPLDDYGASDPAEFFAVATETFFQVPRRLLKGAPDLYGQLMKYYGMNPAEWKRP